MPDLNFVSDAKSGCPQQAQAYVPSFLLSQYLPVNARSVPFSRAIRYSSGVSYARHSSSVFTIFSGLSVIDSSRASHARSVARPEQAARTASRGGSARTMDISLPVGCPGEPGGYGHRFMT